MRKILVIFLLACSALTISGQNNTSLKEALDIVSDGWKKDSGSCTGYRKSVSNLLLKAGIDTTSIDYLIQKLGKPNFIQRYFSGIEKKNYTSYCYYFYRYQCRKMDIESYAISFDFDESDGRLVKVELLEFCG